MEIIGHKNNPKITLSGGFLGGASRGIQGCFGGCFLKIGISFYCPEKIFFKAVSKVLSEVFLCPNSASFSPENSDFCVFLGYFSFRIARNIRAIWRFLPLKPPMFLSKICAYFFKIFLQQMLCAPFSSIIFIIYNRANK